MGPRLDSSDDYIVLHDSHDDDGGRYFWDPWTAFFYELAHFSRHNQTFLFNFFFLEKWKEIYALFTSSSFCFRVWFSISASAFENDIAFIMTTTLKSMERDVVAATILTLATWLNTYHWGYPHIGYSLLLSSPLWRWVEWGEGLGERVKMGEENFYILWDRSVSRTIFVGDFLFDVQNDERRRSHNPCISLVVQLMKDE